MTKGSIDKPGMSEAEKSRREFMKTAGKLAVYTPPALMLLMRPTPDAIAASAGAPQRTDYNAEEDKQGNLVGVESEQDHSNRSFWLRR